jgi:carbonic anhydrase
MLTSPPNPHLGRRRLLSGALATVGLTTFGSLAAGCADHSTAATPKQPIGAPSPKPPAEFTPAQAWARLAAGNTNWSTGKLQHPDQNIERRNEVAAEQHPFATVLSCIDSRVSPEIVFDQGLGDLFVVRTGAHTLDDVVTGSIEYGPFSDGTPLIVVMGHQRCGAVKAALASIEAGTKLPGDLADVVDALRPAVADAKKQSGGDLVDKTVRAHIARTVKKLERDPVLAKRIRERKLGLVGAHYELDTGRVSVLSTTGFEA